MKKEMETSWTLGILDRELLPKNVLLQGKEGV
jgi:hypothetical protein